MNKFIAIIFIFIYNNVFCQDPHFSQFFAAPITLNPALTGSSDNDWRFISNYRTQWQTLAAPYNTTTLSIDTKLIKDKKEGDDDNVLGIGTNFMYDASFFNIVKSTYATLSLSYGQTLYHENEDKHRINLGFGITYGSRRIAFDELNWEDQFTTDGFNTNLPTGEQILSNMKPYISLNTGIIYSISNENKIFEVGGSVYHINKPKQTFLEDHNQVIPVRYVLYTKYYKIFDNNFFVDVNSIYQQQASIHYFIIGGFLGTILNTDAYNMSSISVGCFLRNKDAVYPALVFQKQNWRFNFSYDVTISKLNQSFIKPHSFELCLRYGLNKLNAQIKKTSCPTR